MRMTKNTHRYQAANGGKTTPLRHLQRTLFIHRVVQVLLCILLIYMVLHFQQRFQLNGSPQVFRNSLLATFVLQLALFFPLHRFAGKEVRRELAAATTTANGNQLKALRQQRLFSDIVKGALFLGFTAFIIIAPPATFVLSTAFFSFILTILSYLQSFNFVLRRGLAEVSTV